MGLEYWLPFAIAQLVLSILPGPSVFLVVGLTLKNGLRAAALCILGDLVGFLCMIVLSIAGVGAILAASSELFQIVKWAGVAYMTYLGLSQVFDARKRSVANTTGSADQSGVASAKAGFLVGVLNPKAIIFYVALVSQFFDPTANPTTQFLILVLTSTIIAGTVLFGYALLANQASRAFSSDIARRRFGYASGGFLLGGSAFIAVNR